MDKSNHIDDMAAGWVAREDRGPLDDGEAVRRDAWLDADPRHRGAYLRAHAVFLRAGRASALGRGFGQSLHARSPRRSWRTRWLRPMATAAVLAMVVVGLRFPPQDMRPVSHETGIGEVLRVPLPDGSIMTLNSDSRVRVRYTSGERRVELLRGETLVKVAKNPARPFVVASGKLDVVAVGTSFSVRRATEDSFVVLVNEGVVDIRQEGQSRDPLLVRANHEAVASMGRGVSIRPLFQQDVDRRLAWREGMISFEGETLANAAVEFSRYSSVRILIEDPAVAQLRVVGLYSSSDPEGFARAVAHSMGLEVERTPEGIHLREMH